METKATWSDQGAEEEQLLRNRRRRCKFKVVVWGGFPARGKDVIVIVRSARDCLGSPKAYVVLIVLAFLSHGMSMYNALIISKYNVLIPPSPFRLVSIGLVLGLKLEILMCRSEEHLTVSRQVSSLVVEYLD